MLDVKPYRQKVAHCGPACLKMVLAYYGVEKSEAELARLSGCTMKSGTPASGLLKAAKKCGFRGHVKDLATLGDIRQLVSRKRIPVIVDWFSTEEGHYSVVTKIDQVNIHMQDPELGHARAMRCDVFRRVWFDFSSDYMKSREDLVLRRLIAVYP